MLKISLITICYNCAGTIRDTFDSVLNQTYNGIEYVIIDGKSKDGTVDIIREYEPLFLKKGMEVKWISEKDNGIYEAANKAIPMCTGDVIGSINGDDILHDKDAIKKIVQKFEKDGCDAVYSDLYIMDDDFKTVNRAFIAGKGNYKLGWFPPTPTMYSKRELYDRYWNYDTSTDYIIATDYEFVLKMMKDGVKLSYIHEPLIYMRTGGKSTSSLKSYKKSFDESIGVLKRNGIRFPYMVNIIRTLSIFKQKIAGKIISAKMKNA